MSDDLSHWEWRTFGPDFDAAEAVLATTSPDRRGESTELYLLSESPNNVKVRWSHIDVKILLEVSGDGLERWERLIWSRFPMPAPIARQVLEALGRPWGSFARRTYTQDQFLSELAEPSGIRVVEVHKKRARYVLDRCTVELSDVVAEQRHTRSLAVEAEDADAIRAAMRRLGVGGWANTNYPRGLAALIDTERRDMP